MRRRTLGVEGKNGLDGNVNPLELILLKHLLEHELTILVRVKRGLSEKDLAVPCVDLELLVESVIPNVLNVGPILHNA